MKTLLFNIAKLSLIIWVAILPTSKLCADNSITYKKYDPTIYVDTWDMRTINFFNDSPSYGADGCFDIWKHPDEIVINCWEQSEIIADANNLPLVLDSGMQISSSSGNWIRSQYQPFVNVPNNTGNWNDGSKHFLGMRTYYNGAWHYGWARLEISPSAEYYKLFDYAFNNSQNESIYAGQVSTLGIDDDFKNPVSSQITNFDIRISNSKNASLNITIIDNLGRELMRSSYMSNYISIPIGYLGSGLYFLRIISNNYSSVQAFVK